MSLIGFMATFRPYSPHFIYRWLSDVFAIFNPAGFLDILQWDMLHMAPCLTSDHHHNRLFIKTTGSTEVLYMVVNKYTTDWTGHVLKI